MLRSTLLIAIALVALVLVGGAGCGSSDDETTATPAPAPAAAPPASSDKLDAADADVERGVERTVARYCDGHKATAGELTGAVATLESLYQIDPEAQGPGGKTVREVATALGRELRRCGARKTARRLAGLAG